VVLLARSVCKKLSHVNLLITDCSMDRIRATVFEELRVLRIFVLHAHGLNVFGLLL